MSIGSRILDRRNAAKMSRDALAGKTDMTSVSIENYESEKRSPKANDLKKIARALNTTVAYLSEEIDDPSPDALKPKENFHLSMGGGELAETEVMKLIRDELELVRKLRLEKEKQLQQTTPPGTRSGKNRTSGD